MQTDMQMVAEAFKYLTKVMRFNGRRKLKGELMASPHYRFVEVNWFSPMTRQPMAPRAERRARQGKDFKPVYGYRGPR